MQNSIISLGLPSELPGNYSSLKNRVVFDPMPKGYQYLQPLLQAMLESEAVRVTHTNLFGCLKSERLEPYALCQHESKWWLLCKSEVNQYSLIDLSRIVGVDQLIGDKFRLPASFDAREALHSHFGFIFGKNNGCS